MPSGNSERRPVSVSRSNSRASGSTAREYVLTGGGRIVAGRMCGPCLLVWTGDALFLGTFVGALNQLASAFLTG